MISDPTVTENVCLEITPGQYTNRVIYDGEAGDTKKFVEIPQDTLFFISGCYALDGRHSETYVKLADNHQ